jgi:hypothetical protein
MDRDREQGLSKRRERGVKYNNNIVPVLAAFFVGGRDVKIKKVRWP